MAKKFEFGKGVYYFNIRSSGHSNITIKRNDKEEAIQRYLSYKNLGKDCEWLGMWDGKKFVDDGQPSAKLA